MTPASIDTIREALAYIPPDLPRDEWAQVAMALKAELGSSGFDLFNEWSARGEKYREADARATWRSVKSGGAVKLGTLFHLAKSHGFKFDEVQTPAPDRTPADLAAEAKARRVAVQAEREAQAERQR